MKDEDQIALYHQLTEKALAKVFVRFKENPKLILTESDLKCWLFLKLVKEIERMQKSSLSVHTEVTHYLQTDDRKNRRFRDLTILDSANLNLNENIWKNNDDGDYTLNKGFKHSGPAMHFELKLLRQGLSESSQGKLDSSDINNLNNVDIGIRGYSIVWVSKNDNFGIQYLEEELKNAFESFNRIGLVENDLLRIYLFDPQSYKVYTLDKDRNFAEIINP